VESRVGVGPRLGAYLIDTLLVMGAAYLLRDVAAALAPQAVQVAMAQQPKGEVPPDLQAWVLTAARASVAASLLGPFYGLVEGLSGASPGKLLLGLRVVTTEGHRAPLAQLLERFVIKGGPNLLAFAAILTNLPGLSTAASGFAFLVILGGLLILGAKRQAIHDLAARTAVLRRSDVVR
jgi:uncharacterized RDD family membrane protein YckC